MNLGRLGWWDGIIDTIALFSILWWEIASPEWPTLPQWRVFWALLSSSCRRSQIRTITRRNMRGLNVFIPVASSSSPGPGWSVKQRSRRCPAPRSCWPAHQRHEPGSWRARAAGTAARSGGAPSARRWEKSSSCRCWRGTSPGWIYCLPDGGWWCSHHQTWKMKDGKKQDFICTVTSIQFIGIYENTIQKKFILQRSTRS